MPRTSCPSSYRGDAESGVNPAQDATRSTQLLLRVTGVTLPNATAPPRGPSVRHGDDNPAFSRATVQVRRQEQRTKKSNGEAHVMTHALLLHGAAGPSSSTARMRRRRGAARKTRRHPPTREHPQYAQGERHLGNGRGIRAPDVSAVFSGARRPSLQDQEKPQPAAGTSREIWRSEARVRKRQVGRPVAHAVHRVDVSAGARGTRPFAARRWSGDGVQPYLWL